MRITMGKETAQRLIAMYINAGLTHPISHREIKFPCKDNDLEFAVVTLPDADMGGIESIPPFKNEEEYEVELTEKQQRKRKNLDKIDELGSILTLSEALTMLEDECSEQDPIKILASEEIIDSKPVIEEIPQDLLEYHISQEDADNIKIGFFAKNGNYIIGSLMHMVRDRLSTRDRYPVDDENAIHQE